MSGGAFIPQGLGKYPTFDLDPRVEKNVEAGARVGSAILAGGLPVPLDEQWGGALGVRGSLSIRGRQGPRAGKGQNLILGSPSPMPNPGLALETAPSFLQP